MFDTLDLKSTYSTNENNMWTMKKVSNFSVPGSGKTASVLGVYAYLSSKGLVDKIIMIGPKNSFGSWMDEFQICFAHKKELRVFNIQDYVAKEKKAAVLYNTGNKNLLLFNYEGFDSILNEVLSIIDDKTLLVFDEVHKVKAIGGHYAEQALRIAKKSFFTIAMTGTPIPNSYADIQNILHILYHDEYNDFFGFTESMLKNPSKQDIEIINEKIQPFFCRTTKEQLSVPSANEDIFLETKATKAENQIFSILCMTYAKNKLALIIRLMQLESDPKMLLKAIENNLEDFSDVLYTQGSIDEIDYKDYSGDVIGLINGIDKTVKFNRCIKKVCDLIAEGKSVIIWCIFVDSILNLKYELRKRGVESDCIFGNTSNEDRIKVLNQFREKEVKVLITNPHTLAESVSLHSVCHDAIYFEYSYNLVHLLQSKDRIHRLGLKEQQYTQYYYLQNHFIQEDGLLFSLDQKIYDRLLEKEMLMLDAIENNRLETVVSSDEDIEIVFRDLKL
ncbi:DEAD/DEAH box helicase [Chakrabartyella piscis]|uniref:DEAD/DEAH box helicase n=1 Tax=Chakrabartyella piscis TaxID=2918914 RepID=UPI002958A649|nr:DEAD/DEAH box helicase [Chakrabartyella piscis]